MILVNNRHKLKWHAGMGIRDVLVALDYTYKSIIVRVNGRVVHDEEYDDFVVPDEADVRIIHLIAGG